MRISGKMCDYFIITKDDYFEDDIFTDHMDGSPTSSNCWESDERSNSPDSVEGPVTTLIGKPGSIVFGSSLVDPVSPTPYSDATRIPNGPGDAP
ncbi:unnamed protein product [Cyprideis torosa]|uniref:Uncharacterized protein n=1 Tax=Cyprideis torosa TaxID=163714 RepID=A0A7R8W1S1_9CRUS|nr:unnamed protein product [Cyprideis torosa]CAG0879057.1 unnamed protein product [Cyprideis torosa]